MKPYPLNFVLKTLSVIKRHYKKDMTYNIWYNSVEISITRYGVTITKIFDFNIILKWYNDPMYYFDIAWRDNDEIQKINFNKHDV